MNNKEYESIKQSYWLQFQKDRFRGTNYERDVFSNIFDRAYALGKQEKDTEETKQYNGIKARRKSDGKIIGVTEWNILNPGDSPNGHSLYEVSELDFEINGEVALSGYIARDRDINTGPAHLRLHRSYPDRTRFMSHHTYLSMWSSISDMVLPKFLFPDITWDSEPVKVEIIIKRKI